MGTIETKKCQCQNRNNSRHVQQSSELTLIEQRDKIRTIDHTAPPEPLSLRWRSIS